MGAPFGASAGGFRAVHWRLAGIVSLLVFTILGIVFYTITIIQNRESDAIVIDFAGRQRMLLERHMNEVLLASQGVASQHQVTRALLTERLEALTNGSPTGAPDRPNETILLPAAPTGAITHKFLEQKELVGRLFRKVDEFLALPQGTSRYISARDELLILNSALLEIANEAVVRLTRHSESKVTVMVRWELGLALGVALLGALLTWQMIRTNRLLVSEIAERERAQEELRKSQSVALQALRQSDALKSALISSVSHELRTPLTAIKSMLFSLQGDQNNMPGDLRGEFVGSMHQEIDYLTRLVDNLLDMSRIEAGTLILQCEWHILEELLEGAIRRLGTLLQQRPLNIEIAHNFPPIYVDGLGIQQVLINLLDNAVKFSPADSPINIRAFFTDDAVQVQVANIGQGIPTGEIDRIFERFYRVSTMQEHPIPGTGLGLAICKGIIEAHGGRITAQSMPGRDATFRFWLPTRAETRPTYNPLNQHTSRVESS